MDSMDRDVLETAVMWHRAGRAVMLGTVLKTWGSAPRPIGAMVALRDDGAVKGSVSGGCLEDDLIERVRSVGFSGSTPTVVTYGLSADDAHRFGLPCGGTLRILVEPVRVSSHLDEALEWVRRGRVVIRYVNVNTGEANVWPTDATTPTSFDGVSLRACYGPSHRLLIIGAGQLSEYVARMGVALGYRVIVCDPREEYVGEWSVAHTEVFREMPDDLIARIGLDQNTAVVALTHDPKIDDLALIEALKSPAFYVGAVGSRVNNAKRRERLKLFDLTDTQVAALHGPIGLHIGARTPPEIAVAIMAEMTSHRHGVPVVQSHTLRDAPSVPQRIE
ncbi:XdhC family protein [Burkholderia sp. Bp8989]|nr:XdhC family protein [Burkholderia sp. Bp8995]RQS51801.1 XdhC family protein [Burkholderia sp. Bp8989]